MRCRPAISPPRSEAYGRMMERLGSVGVGADDTLAKIGESLAPAISLRRDRVLDRLESRALLGAARPARACRLRADRNHSPGNRLPQAELKTVSAA